MGNDTTDIKNDLIQSLIMLFVWEKESAKISEICSYIKEQTKYIKSDDLVKGQINILRTDKQLISHDDKQMVSLSDTEKSRIDDLMKQSNISQEDFKCNLMSILEKYGQQDKFDEYYKHLVDLYQSYYRLDIDESEQPLEYDKGVNKVFTKFEAYIEKNLRDKAQCMGIISEIKQLCSENDFINKICITSSFTSLYNSNKLNSYLSQSYKDIYLDTPLLVFMICKNHQPEQAAKWEDPFFQATSGLLDICDEKDNRNTIKLFAPFFYIDEVAGELAKALRLGYFLDFEFYQDMGEVRNSFIKYYSFLKDNDLLKEGVESFEGFIEDMGFENTDPDNTHFTQDTILVVTEFLRQWDIEITPTPYRQTFPSFDTVKKKYEMHLMDTGKTKSAFAVRNDVYAALEIIYDCTGDHTEPDKFFSTWDTSFYDLRELLQEINRSKYCLFHINNPARLLNKLSHARFETKSAIITNDVFAYADATYSISAKVRSLIEMIAPIFGHKNLKNTAFIKEITRIRTSQIDTKASEDATSRVSMPIEDVFENIIRHYKSQDSGASFDKFVELLRDEDKYGALIKIFQSAFKHHVNTDSTAKRIISSLDGLMDFVNQLDTEILPE